MPELSPPAPLLKRHAQRLDAIVRRKQLISRLVAEQRLDIAALAREDSPFGLRKYVGDELALALDESPWTGARWLDEAQMFADYPCVHARMGDGSWSERHADVVLDELVVSGLGREDCTRVVELVVARDDAVTPHQLRAAVRAAIVLLDLEAACRRIERAKRDRDVRAWDSHDGGACALVSGPKPLIAALMACLDSMIWPRQPEDDRTASQRRFDTLMDLVCGRVQPGQWQAQVIVSLATVQGSDEHIAEIPGFGLVLPSEARELIAQAGLRRVVVDEAGRLVSVDSTVHAPDLDPHVGAPAERLWTDQPEPEAPHELPSEVSAQDQAWWSQHGEPSVEVLDLTELVWPTDEPAPTAAELLWWETTTDHAPSTHEDDRTTDRRSARRRPSTAEASDGPPAAPNNEPCPEVVDPLAWLKKHSGPSWSARALRLALDHLRLDKVTHTDLRTDAYVVPKRLKRYLALRDLCCTFPGCARPASQCESDHVVPWPRGATSEANLAPECKHHHLAKHAYFTVVRLPDGTMRWTTPTGASYDRRPRPLLRGW